MRPFGDGLTDFHCHLAQYVDIPAHLARLAESHGNVLIATSRASEFRGIVALVGDEPRVVPGLGMHPEIAGSVYEAFEFDIFRSLVSSTRLISEIGMDAVLASAPSRNFGATPTIDAQADLFDRVLDLLGESHVVSIHSRGAEDRVINALDQANIGRVVMHSFLGDRDQMMRAVDAGCYFSINPWMLTPGETLEVVRAMPEDRLLIETDGPFSTVEGKPSSPADCSTIAIECAAARGADCEEFIFRILKNQKIFWG